MSVGWHWNTASRYYLRVFEPFGFRPYKRAGAFTRRKKHSKSAAEEIGDANRYFFRYVKENWASVDLKPFHYIKTDIGPVGKSYDVFGDGSIILVNTPGHSHGLFSAVIKNNGKYVVLAGDTVYTQKSIQEKRIPGFTVSTELARKSLEWICKCAADDDCLLVAANHDPTIKPQVIEL